MSTTRRVDRVDRAGAEPHNPRVSAPTRAYAVVFDFDGTILPSVPWDSEQTLLLARAAEARSPWALVRRWYARWIALADRRGWLGSGFKGRYTRLLRGCPVDLLDEVASTLALRVPKDTRGCLRELRARGHRLLVASCGTADLSERILRAAGVVHCFEAVVGNRFVFERDRIAGMRLEVPSPAAKLQAVQAMGLDPESTVAVGDGPTDLPLLRWARFPVVVAPAGGKRPVWARDGWAAIGRLSGLTEILQGLGG